MKELILENITKIKCKKRGVGEFDTFIQDQDDNLVAVLVQKAKWSEGYDIIPQFEVGENFIKEAGSLQPAFFIIKSELERITGRKIEY